MIDYDLQIRHDKRIHRRTVAGCHQLIGYYVVVTALPQSAKIFARKSLVASRQICR